MVKKDKENFPHKLGQLSNWDETLLPQHCGHFEKKPNFLLFTVRGPSWKFIGAYSTPEIVAHAEQSVMHPHVISSFDEFCYDVPKKALQYIAEHFVVKIPIAKEDITHEMVWDLLQLHIADNDVFDKLNAWDWLRSIFPGVGSTNNFEMLSRFGCYKMVTLRGVLKDLRSPKYAKGKCIDIRPLHPYRREAAKGMVPHDGTYETEKVNYAGKIWTRIK